MVKFGTLQPSGRLTNVREIKQSDIARCPHYIFAPDHYRPDGTCKCNDKDDPQMRGYGYRWDRKKKQWV